MKNIQEEIIRAFGNQLRVRVSGICIESNKILMVSHRNLGELGYLWAPPGGGLLFGESLEETLQREFKEETGLEIEIIRFLFVNEFLKAPLHAIEIFFEVKKTDGVLKKGSDPEMPAENQLIDRVCFLGKEEIQKEGALNLHSVFRDLGEVSDILLKQGYFHSKN